MCVRDRDRKGSKERKLSRFVRNTNGRFSHCAPLEVGEITKSRNHTVLLCAKATAYPNTDTCTNFPSVRKEKKKKDAGKTLEMRESVGARGGV